MASIAAGVRQNGVIVPGGSVTVSMFSKNTAILTVANKPLNVIVAEKLRFFHPKWRHRRHDPDGFEHIRAHHLTSLALIRRRGGFSRERLNLFRAWTARHRRSSVPFYLALCSKICIPFRIAEASTGFSDKALQIGGA